MWSYKYFEKVFQDFNHTGGVGGWFIQENRNLTGISNNDLIQGVRCTQNCWKDQENNVRHLSLAFDHKWNHDPERSEVAATRGQENAKNDYQCLSLCPPPPQIE